MQPTEHKHEFETKDIKVLLHDYKPDEGKMKFQSTKGYDILKRRVCKCGYSETIDLERTVL